MNSTLGFAIVLAVFGVAIILLLLFWFRRRDAAAPREPTIELEKLVKCRTCGSLIPEGVRKCAFCGAWQVKQENREVRSD